MSAVIAGGLNTCALLTDGHVRCWGRNDSGQLGLGFAGTPMGDDETPAEVGDVPLPGPVARVEMGASHTCALLVEGSLVCWGRNSHGELGLGHTEPIGDDEIPATAVPIEGPIDDFALGRSTTCVTGDGEVWCWGRGDNGANGQVSVESLGDDESVAEIPPIVTGMTIEDITVGNYHVCGLSDLGEVLCWGDNEYQQRGYPHTMNIGDDEQPVTAGPVPLW